MGKVVPLLRWFTLNNHNIRNSFEFANDIIQQNSGLFMASVDIDSHFTNISLDETINISKELLFQKNSMVSGLNNKQMFEMLSITLKESFILFNNKCNSQVYGSEYGLPLPLMP